MTFETWLAFAASSTILLLIPGPTVLLVFSYALSQGRRVALVSVSGVALGDFAAMTLSLVGLGTLLLSSATLFTALKWIGAGYLVFLGVKLWRAGITLPTLNDGATQDGSRRIFSHAFVVTALNPKSIAFFVAFVPQFVDYRTAVWPQLAIMEVTFVGLAAINALLFALAADGLRSRLRQEFLRWLNRTGAACLVGMGVAAVAIDRD